MYQFLGRFHPLLVHIPIGVLLLAFLMEYFIFKKKAAFSFAIEVTLLIGYISAIVAAILGWLLSFSGEYDVTLLNKHQWWGISLCFVSFFLWGFKKYASQKPYFEKLYKPLFFLTILLLLVTGHFGGSLTHGEDFLSYQSILQEDGKKTPDSLLKKIQFNNLTPSLTVYKDLGNPIFETKCISCHNSKKKKGDYQMQTYDFLLKGGKSGKKIVQASVVDGELIKRMLLDKNEDKHMPPKGKGQLTQSEINLIYWWFYNGASPEIKILDVKTNDTIKTFLSNQGPEKKPALNLKKVKEANLVDLASFKTINWQVSPISKGSPFLEVNAGNVPEFSNTHQSLLLKIAPQVAWLILGNTKITDAGMPAIGKCSNIVKLNLQNTIITNSSIVSINLLTQLEYLNIAGTGITDEGLFQLKVNKSLKKIFCWNAKITKDGVMRFKKLHPFIEIDFFLKYPSV